MSSLELRDVDRPLRQARGVVRAFTRRRSRSGEWLGLIGPNGAGKSSLLRAVVGLVDHDGEIARRRRRRCRCARGRRRAALVAYVPQAPADARRHDRLRVRAARPQRRTSATSAPRPRTTGRWSPTCSSASISSEFADRRLGTLSGGERQRLVIARALAQEAPILLLDEPTSALDIGHQQQALELVARLRREHGLTVVSAMHDLTLAGLYSDRLALLHEGTSWSPRAPPPTCCGPRRWPSSTASA